MLFTPHLAVGAAIGAATNNSLAAFLIGFIAHHILDLVPHTDSGSYAVHAENIFKRPKILLFVLSDVLLGLILFTILYTKSDYSPPVFWGSLGCIAPDLIDNLPYTSKFLQKFFPFNYYHKLHDIFHYTISDRRHLWIGYLTQIFAIAVSILYILR